MEHSRKENRQQYHNRHLQRTTTPWVRWFHTVTKLRTTTPRKAVSLRRAGGTGPDFQIAQRKRGRGITHSPKAEIICKAILKLSCLKLKPTRSDWTVLLLCFISAGVQETLGTGAGETQTHLQLQTNPSLCLSLWCSTHIQSSSTVRS